MLMNWPVSLIEYSGSILSVESNSIKASEGVFGGNQLDPEASVSTEDKMKLRRMTQIVRVYYVVGQPANEQIGMCLSFTSFNAINVLRKLEYTFIWNKFFNRMVIISNNLWNNRLPVDFSLVSNPMGQYKSSGHVYEDENTHGTYNVCRLDF